jgi:hypothetical protein
MAKPNLAKFRITSNVEKTGQHIISSFFSKNTKPNAPTFQKVSVYHNSHDQIFANVISLPPLSICTSINMNRMQLRYLMQTTELLCSQYSVLVFWSCSVHILPGRAICLGPQGNSGPVPLRNPFEFNIY